jgi:hypothetical protein
LLSWILIDPELTETAKNYIQSGENETDVKSKLTKDLCEFFKYLTGLLSLQQRKLQSVSLPSDSKENILNLFKTIPTNSDDSKLLLEISMLFEEFFTGSIGKSSTISSNIQLLNSYPELMKLKACVSEKNPLKQTNDGILGKIITELGTFGYLSEIGISLATNELKFTKGSLENFAKQNTTYYMPLVILGIKMIQLLHTTLDRKYVSLSKLCKS